MYSARKVSCAERPVRVEVASLAASVDFWGFCLPRETLEEPYVNLRVKTSLNVCGLRDRWNLQSLAVFGPFKRGDVVPWSNYSYFGQVLRTQNHGLGSPHPHQKPHLQPHRFVAIHRWGHSLCKQQLWKKLGDFWVDRFELILQRFSQNLQIVLILISIDSGFSLFFLSICFLHLFSLFFVRGLSSVVLLLLPSICF